MGGGRAGLRRETATLVHALELDTVAAEVVRALDAAGVQSILLKGASLADWLYRGQARPYEDVDLLVRPDSVSAAGTVLAAIRFTNESAQMAPCEHAQHAADWRRGNAWLDLHHTIFGATVSPERVWAVLSAHTHRIAVGGTSLVALQPHALACLCALHAAHHGQRVAKPLLDLTLALKLGDEGLWRAAANIADQLGALSAFGTGLRLSPVGARVAHTLRLPFATALAVTIRAESSPRLISGLQQLVDTPGIDRWHVFGRKLVPTPAFLRATLPFAQRNRAALALAYVWRLIWIAGGAVPALIRWARLRSRLTRSESGGSSR